MNNKTFYKSRLRPKRQLTLPDEIRRHLSAEEGDDLVFRSGEAGHVYLEKIQTIPPEQAWFWSERWQRMERESQTDIDDNRIRRYENIEEAISDLEGTDNARNRDR